jgi:hypothetical protein
MSDEERDILLVSYFTVIQDIMVINSVLLIQNWTDNSARVLERRNTGFVAGAGRKDMSPRKHPRQNVASNTSRTVPISRKQRNADEISDIHPSL